MTLVEAQKEISSNWVTYYQAVSAGKPITPTTVTPTQTPNPVPTPVVTPTPVQTIIPVVTPSTTGHPAGVTGKCNDGTYTSAINHSGACSHHGGVSVWY